MRTSTLAAGGLASALGDAVLIARIRYRNFVRSRRRRKRPAEGKRTAVASISAAIHAAAGRGRRSQPAALTSELAAWRRELMDDLGGPQAVTTAQAAIIDLAAQTKLLLDSIDAWMLGQPTLVNPRKRTVVPIVLERLMVADALVSYLQALGLKRRIRDLHPARVRLSQGEHAAA